MSRIYRRPFDKLPPTEQERNEQAQKRAESWQQFKVRVESGENRRISKEG